VSGVDVVGTWRVAKRDASGRPPFKGAR